MYVCMYVLYAYYVGLFETQKMAQVTEHHGGHGVYYYCCYFFPFRAFPRVVRIDFVATEDGSHILTVSVGPKIFLFAPVGEDAAQHNIVIMKESESHNKRPMLQKASSLAAASAAPLKKMVKWINLRTVELDSIDGLPPLPMTISWVRDGILVVGMESEMRVYNQWRFNLEEGNE